MMSEMIKVSFPDGAIKEFSKGTTTEEIASSISPGLKKKAIAGKVNNELFDLRRQLKRMRLWKSLPKAVMRRLKLCVTVQPT